MRRTALPRPRSRAGPRGGLAGRRPPRPPRPILTGRLGAEGGAGRRLGWRMPRAGPAILDAQAAGPAPPTAEGGRGERGRRRAGGGGGAGPTISSSPGAEAEREVPRAPPPSALPPRRLSAAGSRHDAETASKRNRLRRAAPPRSPSPPPPERRHRLGSLPLPGARLWRRLRARPVFSPTRERGAGPGG